MSTPVNAATRLCAVIMFIAVGTILTMPQPRADAHAPLRQTDPENGATLQRSPEALTLTFTEEPIPASDAVTAPSPFDAVARWLFYAGLAGVMGCAWVWTQVLPSAAAESWRAPWLAWIAAALGVAGLEETRRAAAGVDVVPLLNTWLGWTMAWRAVFVLSAAAALLLGVAVTGAQRRAALIAAGCCASLGMLAHVAAGHAAAAPAWRWASAAIQWLHVSVIGAWLGGLAALLLAVGRTPRGDRTAALRRFSVIAGVLFAMVVATGATLTIQEVGAWDRLYTTPYGRLILIKIGLLVALVILGVLRYRSIALAAQTLRVFRRVGTLEVAVAGVTLVVAAILTQTAPAGLGEDVATAGGSGRVVAIGNDFATSVRARLEISPGVPGLNRFALTLRDYDTDSPVRADRVSLRFRSVGHPDLAPSTLSMVRQPRDEVYRAQGVNLSVEGRWVVVAIVERELNSIEVPLVVTLRSQPQNVRGVSVPVRRFGPGHFVGDTTLSPGRCDIEVTASAGESRMLLARFQVRA